MVSTLVRWPLIIHGWSYQTGIGHGTLRIKISLHDTIKGSVLISISYFSCACLLILKDTVYDAFALTCGYIFCYICACSAASVAIVDGLKAVSPDKNCPMSREKVESYDKSFQYLLFHAEPYEIIAFKVPSTEIDKSTPKFFSHWDPDSKMFMLYFKVSSHRKLFQMWARFVYTCCQIHIGQPHLHFARSGLDS